MKQRDDSGKLPSERELQVARERFASLLGQPKTPERFWQQLFSECPYILSMSLPLKLIPTDIHPVARPGESDPDLIFYPSTEESVSVYGVIELKTPQSKILTRPRKDLITLSRTADTAVHQAFQYNERLESNLIRPEGALIFGGTNFVFVIIGLSTELSVKLTSDILGREFRRLVPSNCQLIPYDLLFQMFQRSIPPKVFYLSPGGILPIQDNRNLDEALYRAMNREEVVTAHTLLDAGAGVWYRDQGAFPNTGLTALHWASLYGNIELTQRLVRRGADVNATDMMGRTPLFPAAANGHVEVAEYLLRHGADVSAMNYRGWTLTPAAQRNSTVVKLLALYGWVDTPEW